jgi:WD40 repeat protein
MCFGKDSRWLASASGDHSIKVWDTTTWQELRTLSPGHANRVYALALSPDGRWLASGGGDRTVKVWDTTTWKNVTTLPCGNDDVHTPAWSPDGKTLAAPNKDGHIYILRPDLPR